MLRAETAGGADRLALESSGTSRTNYSKVKALRGDRDREGVSKARS